MSFVLNTNITSMNAQRINRETSKDLESSITKLSSGLRITKAADDMSGEAISNSLRKQSSALGQSIRNANDAVAIIQIADKAMDEQLKILDTIKAKATQAAQNGQTIETRMAIQKDVTELLKSLDSIALNTSYNSQSLLSGSFTNKRFQVGAYSQESIDLSIHSTLSSKVGSTRFETFDITTSGVADLTFTGIQGFKNIDLESVTIGTLKPDEGIKQLAEVINKNSNTLGGVRASWQNIITSSASVVGGNISDLKINGINFGNIDNILANDSNGTFVNAINMHKGETGIEAYTDERGRINLQSLDGRGIVISATSGLNSLGLLNDSGEKNFGRLTLSRATSTDITFTDANNLLNAVAGETLNLEDFKGSLDSTIASAIGTYANTNQADNITALAAGLTSISGAMALMDVADAAIRELDSIRANIGSYENNFLSTINNISVTQVNVDAARSQLKDVDFAQESAFFNKKQLLTQSGSYALSQANQIPENVQKLLS